MTLALYITLGIVLLGCVGAWAGVRIVKGLTTQDDLAPGDHEWPPHVTSAPARTNEPPPPLPDPLGLKSWRKAGYSDYRVTLNNGSQYEGHVLWKSFPDAVKLTALNNQDELREHLQRLAQQIEWKQHEDKREDRTELVKG